ncbi:hypothetical protein MKX01_001171 [Papaver californicum]|nr:hypothetical protein MKX01_001171 [Papaver californicum]
MKFGGILGFDNGVMLAPMGADIAGPELVAAVANAGGIGLIASPVSLGKKIRAIFDQKLACLQVYWGDFPKEMVDEAHKHGVKVIHQVGSVKTAERAIAAGVDCIVAQGSEAGGHIAGTVKCIATKEAYAHDYYKQQLLHYNEEQTDRTDLYERFNWKAPVRCIRTPFYEQWRNAPDFVQNDSYQPIVGKTIFFENEAVLRRFSGQVMNRTTTGNLEDMVMYAGQGVGLVNDIVPAGEVVRRFVDGAKAIIEGLSKIICRSLRKTKLMIIVKSVKIEDYEKGRKKKRGKALNKKECVKIIHYE